jgi:hypothetical protein
MPLNHEIPLEGLYADTTQDIVRKVHRAILTKKEQGRLRRNLRDSDDALGQLEAARLGQQAENKAIEAARNFFKRHAAEMLLSGDASLGEWFDQLFLYQEKYNPFAQSELLNGDISDDEVLSLPDLFEYELHRQIPDPRPEWLIHPENIEFIDNIGRIGSFWEFEIAPLVGYQVVRSREGRSKRSPQKLLNGIIWTYCTTELGEDYPALPENYPSTGLCVQQHQVWSEASSYLEALRLRTRELLTTPSVNNFMLTDHQGLLELKQNSLAVSREVRAFISELR